MIALLLVSDNKFVFPSCSTMCNPVNVYTVLSNKLSQTNNDA